MNYVFPLIALLSATFALPASAGLVTIDGSDISISYDPSNFVAGPNTTGDAFSYSTGSISAQAAGDISATSSSVSFVIALTNPNDQFSNVSVQQYGQYALSGPGASVSLLGSTLTVASGNLSASNAITPTTPTNLDDGATHVWTAAATDDLSGPSWSGVRTIDVTVSNMLTATAPAGSTAWISAGSGASDASATTVTVGLSETPLPASFPLFAGGLGLIAAIAVMRSASRTTSVRSTPA